ncbi:MAG: substrate-binding domain-containing protein [Muribaculaceae bacterium]|nr:substrate-binding domain-containing protein [Muribaculaceae bacterium]
MKPIINSNCLLLLVVILFSSLFPSCRKSDKFKIGVSQCSSDDWRSKLNEELRLEAMLHDDVELEIRSADDSNEKQIRDIQYFVEKGFDIIVVAPNEAEPLTSVIRSVYEKGLPVIIFDRNINDTTYTQRIGVDNIGLGESAARYSLNLATSPINVMELYGLRGSTPAEDRHLGFKRIIEEAGGKIVASEAADWTLEKAVAVSDTMIANHPEVNLIFAHNDRMAMGASEVADKLGRNDIKIIGIDAAPSIGIKAVKDGVIDATFLYPTEGSIILKEALKILHGQPYEKEVMLPLSSAVDATNADILLRQNEVVMEDTEKIRALKTQLDDYLSRHSAQTILFYAIIVILVLLFGFLFLVLRTFWQHRRHQEALMKQNRLLEEERDKQKELNRLLEEATQSKLVFFTNVSHDLRTPLTLIAEPVSQLNMASNLDSRQKTLVKIADKNVKILQRLINQILDFRKYENNKLNLNLVETDFSRAVNEWFDSFRALAKKRNIRFTLDRPKDGQPVCLAMDVEKIERVFFNLVSNAFKYSPDNSVINVSYEIKDNRLIFKVLDSGEGISAENIKNIFDRFFQVDKVRPRGSGIGLSLAKAFIELHGGSISVESELKKGSVFTVSLPVVHVSETPQEVEVSITADEINAELDDIETETNFEDEKPVLLVIDDNRDIRELVTELLKDDYNVLQASNGKEGIKKAVKYVPDLIVCDVMMPGIDGMETCSRLKKEEITSHIPVLMLTACSMDEQRVQGFESGADGYLSKPFSSAVLKSQVASLIFNRRKIKDIYEKRIPSSVPLSEKRKALPKNSGVIDDDFYNKFLEIFEKEMGNPDLNVEAIASSMGFERTQLYRKLKAITNYSPVELMRNLRLKKSRKLLATTDKTISEICYEVGFSTPAYFTKCFREQFGMTPTEFREKQ